MAEGGGIEIPPNADFTGGATVTISNSVITGNRVAPTQTLPFGPPCPGNVNCPYAAANGGGIDSWGTLTLTNTTVSNNRVGTASGLSSIASDARRRRDRQQPGTADDHQFDDQRQRGQRERSERALR